MDSPNYTYCSSYAPKSMGRLLHFLCIYCGLTVSEWCQINNANSVDLKNGNDASFMWDWEGNPIFKFAGPDAPRYELAQQKKKAAARQGITWKPDRFKD